MQIKKYIFYFGYLRIPEKKKVQTVTRDPNLLKMYEIISLKVVGGNELT